MDLAASGRNYALHKSFKNAIKGLLTACSREYVKRAFPSFTDGERERLYRLLNNVLKSMYANLEEGFDELCQEGQVAAALDKIGDFVEEQSLDVLPSDDNSIEEVEQKILKLKKDEIEYLAGSLKKVEESNNDMKARIELLKKEEDLTAARDLVNKMKQWNSAYRSNIGV